MEVKVSNYLIKVGVKTLVFLLTLTIILTSLFLVIVPAKASDVCYSLGLKDISARLEVGVFENSGDVNDLAKLYDRAVEAGNYEIVYEFGGVLYNFPVIDEYAAFREKYGSVDYKSYVLGNNAIAKLKVDGVEGALDLLDANNGRYSRTCGFSYFIAYMCENPDKLEDNDAAATLQALDKLYDQTLEVEGLKLIAADAYYLQTTFGLDSSSDWQARYQK